MTIEPQKTVIVFLPHHFRHGSCCVLPKDDGESTCNRLEQAATMNRKKVLNVKSVCVDHVPRTRGREGAARDRTVIFRRFIQKEGKRKRWFRSIKEIDRSVTLFAGKNLLSRKLGRTAKPRHVATSTVGSILPSMKRTLDAVPDNLAQPQVRSKMRTNRLHHIRFTVGVTVSDQATVKHGA